MILYLYLIVKFVQLVIGAEVGADTNKFLSDRRRIGYLGKQRIRGKESLEQCRVHLKKDRGKETESEKIKEKDTKYWKENGRNGRMAPLNLLSLM